MNQQPSASLVMVAAGSGSRFNAGSARGTAALPKTLQRFAGAKLVVHALKPFLRVPELHDVVLVVRQEDETAFRKATKTLARQFKKKGVPFTFAHGGAERADSAYNGLEKTRYPATLNEEEAQRHVVLFHDAARALVTPHDIRRVIHATFRHGVALLVGPVVDTIKKAGPYVEAQEKVGRVEGTIDRSQLRAAYTPQGLQRGLAYRFHHLARENNLTVTDDVSLAEHAGHLVHYVETHEPNLKVTHPADAHALEGVLRSRMGFWGRVRATLFPHRPSR